MPDQLIHYKIEHLPNFTVCTDKQHIPIKENYIICAKNF